MGHLQRAFNIQAHDRADVQAGLLVEWAFEIHSGDVDQAPKTQPIALDALKQPGPRGRVGEIAGLKSHLHTVSAAQSACQRFQ